MNIIENIEKEQISKLMEGKNVPSFKPGDTLKVHTKVKEGDRVIYSQYSGTDVKLEDEEYIIVNQSDIIAIVE